MNRALELGRREDEPPPSREGHAVARESIEIRDERNSGRRRTSRRVSRRRRRTVLFLLHSRRRAALFLARSALIFASSDGPGSAFSPRRHKGWVGRARRPSLTRASPTHIVDGTYPRRARYSFPPAASSRRLRGRDLGVRSGSRRLPRGTRGEPRWRGRCLRGGARTRDATRRRDRRRAATTAGNDDDARARPTRRPARRRRRRRVESDRRDGSRVRRRCATEP